MVMARWERTIVDASGNIIPGANFEVRKEQPGAALAALKSDRTGVSGIANPGVADANGKVAFHVAGGAYKIRVWTGPSGAPTYEETWRYVGIGLASESDVSAGDVVGPSFSTDGAFARFDGVTGKLLKESPFVQIVPVINVKAYGAAGDGTTDDSAAIATAETARAAVGGELVFPPGTYKNDGTSINRANGGGWRGIGQVRFVPTANSVIFMNVSGAVVSATDPRPFYVENIHFDGDGYSSIIAYNETAPYQTTLNNISITELQYAALFTGPNSSTQTGWINISNVKQVGSGCWAFLGYDNTKYIFAVNISNFVQNGTAASAWTGATQLFFLRRAVSVMFDNVLAKALDGAASGIYMLGDCQGIFINNTVIVWPTYGIRAEAWTDSLKPAYVYVSNFGVDQHTVSGADIAGRTWFISNSNFANGYARTNSGQACIIKSTSTDVAISNCLFAYDQKHGLVIETGAAKVRVNGITAENNNQAAGSNYDVNLQASTYLDVLLYGRNIIGSAGVNATGQRVVNGVTSKEVYRDTGSVATTAVNTQEDLMSYTIPANVLKPGQKVRVTAWGRTAANGNTKTFRLWFGGNSILDHSGAFNNSWWRLNADILITGASAQEYTSNAQVTASVPTVRGTTLAVTDTSSIIVKCTGQNGTANAGDITCEGFTLEILD